VPVEDADGILRPPDSANTFAGRLTKTSILDLISFPDEGKEHFRNRVVRMRNVGADAQRAFEESIIQERVRRRARGEVSGDHMEAEIAREQWYIDGVAELHRVHNINMIDRRRWVPVPNELVWDDDGNFTSIDLDI